MSEQPTTTTTTHTRRNVQRAYTVAGALALLPGAARYDITEALRSRAADHEHHAATMRDVERAGGLDYMTPEAAGRIAEHHEARAVHLFDLADLLDAGAEAHDVAELDGIEALAEHIRDNYPD